jgi:hypothetical protein
MQVARFTNGGYVVHKITGNFVGRMSAWFDKDGKILDAEQILAPFGSSRPVKRDGPMWKLAQEVGDRYKNIPVE